MPNFGTLTNDRKPALIKSADRAVIHNTLSGESPSALGSLPVVGQQSAFNLPMIMTTILIFMQLGRPFDQFLTGMHLPAVIGILGLIVMFFTPWTSALKNRVGVPLVLFLILLCVACAFSTWRGGSVLWVQQFVELNLIVFCLVAVVPATIGQLRWLVLMALFACAFNVAAGSNFDVNGRLRLTDEMYGNSDDVALIGGFCIPLVILWAHRMNKVLGFIVGSVGVVACLAAVGLSAARFALISLTVMALLIFLRGNAKQKIGLLIAFVILAVGALLFLPKSTLDRFSTITSAVESEGGDVSQEAIGSMRDRQQLASDAFEAFLTHPLLGVGPNVFVDWRYSALHKRGEPAHNTYLQAAAEEGFLGPIFYVAFLIGTFATLSKSIKSLDGWEEGRTIALTLERCLIYFATSACFINGTAHTHQFVVAAAAVALERLRSEHYSAASSPALSSEGKASASPQLRRPLPSSPGRSPLASPAAAPVPEPRFRFNRSVPTSRK